MNYVLPRATQRIYSLTGRSGRQSGDQEMGRNLPALPSPAEETWFVFGILAEFVDGFEPISLVPPAVSIFGSARSQVGDASYQPDVYLGRELG